MAGNYHDTQNCVCCGEQGQQLDFTVTQYDTSFRSLFPVSYWLRNVAAKWVGLWEGGDDRGWLDIQHIVSLAASSQKAEGQLKALKANISRRHGRIWIFVYEWVEVTGQPHCLLCLDSRGQTLAPPSVSVIQSVLAITKWERTKIEVKSVSLIFLLLPIQNDLPSSDSHARRCVWEDIFTKKKKRKNLGISQSLISLNFLYF